MLKMLRRDGWGSGLLERIGIYWREVEFERTGGCLYSCRERGGGAARTKGDHGMAEKKRAIILY